MAERGYEMWALGGGGSAATPPLLQPQWRGNHLPHYDGLIGRAMGGALAVWTPLWSAKYHFVLICRRRA